MGILGKYLTNLAPKPTLLISACQHIKVSNSVQSFSSCVSCDWLRVHTQNIHMHVSKGGKSEANVDFHSAPDFPWGSS